MNATPFVSVIIPTYHDWDRLKLCLNALEQQSYPANRFEVLVVNNDPEDQPAYEVANGNVRLLQETKPGSYAARNAAIRVAKGEVFAFTDSDCIPDKDWLSKGIADLINLEADVISGTINVFRAPNTTSAAWKYESIVAFRQHHRECLSAITANLLTWKKTFDHIGLFAEIAYSGGDSQWSDSAKKRGKVFFRSDALINHPARTSIQSIIKRNRRVTGARLQRSSSTLDLTLIILKSILPPFRSVTIWRASGACRVDCTIVFFLRSIIKLSCSPVIIKHLLGYKLTDR